MRYVVRQQGARIGHRRASLLVAVFPLRQAGALCFQLQDEGDLRRGGVYLVERDDPEALAWAPRFDELFADMAAKLQHTPQLREPLLGLLKAGQGVARRCVPRLDPETLEELGSLAEEALALEQRQPELPGGFSLEALVMVFALIFVSEEERYPRPRYKGCDLTYERLLEVVGS